MKKWTKLIAIYLLLVAIVAAIAYSLAAYTSLSSAKRVITVRGSEQYFTSDILIQYEGSSLQTRVKSFGKNDKTRTFSVKVSNHLQNDSTKYDKKNTEYTFTVELVDANGEGVTDTNVLNNVKVGGNSLESNKYEKTTTLVGGKEANDTYTITLTGDEILQYRIKITAVPKNRSEYKPLGRLILLTTDTTVTNWTGSFLTTEQSAVGSDKKIGLINYRISGHLEEDCILTWDASKIEIDKWFLDQMGINSNDIREEKNNKNSVTLHLGAAGTPQQYTIQFYRTYAVGDLTDENWDTIKNYIQFTNSKGE